ncbi:hypothetical protein C8Q80DRAFT_1265169 [Daedaleopsis nitida]|nr:hypothetical protein C8Q80DRAFT_1265169 [Daedaleopsis nitida]
MSAETVARWNAIPLNRPDPDQSVTPSLKRSRQEDDGAEGDSDDNVSLVSRTPSPPLADAMDIDKYDEYYAHKPQREVVTVETKIKSNNVGFAMLAKMGWVEGSPLGLSGDGRVDPVPFYVKNDLTGLGKANQDVRMIETTVSQRRELDSERQIKETEEQRRQREARVTFLLFYDAVARREAVKSEISSVLRPFYCEVCEKQFQNVAQYDEHTNSYAHHHKVRFRDMQAAQRASRNTEEEVNKRKEKERKREEKELRKIAKAAGVKMAKPPASLAPVPATDPANAGGAPKKGGWATVSTATSSSAALPAPAPAPTPSRSGWASVSETQPTSGPSRSGWAPVSAPPPPPPGLATSPLPGDLPPPPPRSSHTGAPSFRTGGWTHLETSIVLPTSQDHTHPPPPPPMAAAPMPPLPLAPTSNDTHQGWSSIPRPSGFSGWTSQQPPPGVPAPPQVQTVQMGANPSRPPVQLAEPARQEPSRSGWQKFRAGAPGRRR